MKQPRKRIKAKPEYSTEGKSIIEAMKPLQHEYNKMHMELLISLDKEQKLK